MPIDTLYCLFIKELFMILIKSLSKQSGNENIIVIIRSTVDVDRKTDEITCNFRESTANDQADS